MASVNKAIVLGNVGQDPEIRYTANGDAVCSFSIATSDRWKDKDGQQQNHTEWHNIVMYRRLAEVAGEYVRKGSSIYIEGRIQTRKWQTKDGQDRYTTEIIADQMQMLGNRQDGERSQSQDRKPQGAATQGSDGFDDFGEDVPF